MMTDDRLHRRRLLQLAGGLAVAGIAGCTGTPNEVAEGIDARSTAQSGTPDEPGTGTGGHGHGAGSHDDHSGEHHHEDDTPRGHTPGDDPHAHEDAGHIHEEPVGPPVEHATVRMVTTSDGFHFEPHVVRITVGGSVTFVNESGAHSATAYHPANDRPLRIPDGATPWDTGLLSADGAEFEHTFETEGVYQYYCIPHESMGMIGAIIVGDPDPHGQPGLAPPQARLSDRAAEKITALNDMCNQALGHTHD